MLHTNIPLRHYLAGAGTIEQRAPLTRLAITDATQRVYSDAQLDDFGVPGAKLRWRPPLRMQVRARFSHPAGTLPGTAGFGFWNYPIRAIPRLPQAIWFFHAAPPTDMPFALGGAGHGWKAATIDTLRWSALRLLPLAPFATVLMQSRRLYRWIWPGIQRGCAISESPLQPTMTDWHDYRLDWGCERAAFFVDGQGVLETAPTPRGPLCFVAWLDNQYLIATPQARFGWGLVAMPGAHWLEIAQLTIEPMLQ